MDKNIVVPKPQGQTKQGGMSSLLSFFPWKITFNTIHESELVLIQWKLIGFEALYEDMAWMTMSYDNIHKGEAQEMKLDTLQ